MSANIALDRTLANQNPNAYDRALPWNRDLRGEQVLPLINDDVSVMRMEAGAGTGKTTGLRRRILRILHPDGLGVAPHRVLVCAFNRVIAKDLEREIADELAPHGLTLPVIRTIHGLCTALIAGEPPRLMLPHEIAEMIYDIRVTHAEVNDEFNRRQATALRALREHEAGFQEHPALAIAVRRWLNEHGAGLVGDVPRQVEAALRAGDLEDRYDHVVVDEFQDLTDTEARLVVGLRAVGGSFIAVGDRKQSIYAFRGNAERGLDALPELVEGPISDATMNECWRCPSEIVGLANAVVALEGKPLKDVLGEGGQVHQVQCKTPEDEARRMAQEIVRVYRAQPDKKHLAMVTRRKWGYDLRNAIRELDPDVPVQTVFAEDVLQTWPAREAFIFFSVLGDPNDAVTLRDWVAYQAAHDGKDFLAPGRNARAYVALKAVHGVLSVDRVNALESLPDREFHGSGKTNVRSRLARLRALLRAAPLAEDIPTRIDHVFDPGKWIDYAGPDADLARQDIERLRAEARRLHTDMPGLDIRRLVRALRYRIATREPIGAEDKGGIRIVTLWGAKGLTADYVYILGLCDEALPGPYDPESTGLTEIEHQDEQRRLLYVSLTRAKAALVLSRPARIKPGLVGALGLTYRPASFFWQSLTQTRFFHDVPRDVLPDAVRSEEWPGLQLAPAAGTPGVT